MRELLDSLNPAQRTAVEHPGGPLLVIAGAGSGKTRVLTARVACLIARGVRPDAILAFTFTNRAAREMRGRIASIAAGAGPWVGTFHATGVRILRREARRIGLPRDFVIYDREDQETLIGELAKQLGWPESLKRSRVIGAISDAKNAFVGPEEFLRTAHGPDQRRIAEGYALYQEMLRRNGSLDFDDLIVETARLLITDPEAGAAWGRRFEHVLVDEYQDTNHAQFRLIRALAGSGNVFVVGDDDQSIYGWRGADLANVLEFEQTFPGAAVLRLEQNYRSTGNILKAANAVISNNRARKGKELWCDREDGPMLEFALALDEQDEARRVREILGGRLRRGGRLGDVAVLYRTNAQSRALETELRAALMAYEVVGGVAFYQRREIKDLIAYLRLALVPEDAVAFFRVWNTPRRGLGPAVRGAIEERMRTGGGTPMDALRALVGDGALTPAARRGATGLIELADELRALTEAPVDRLLVRVLERTAYLEWLGEDEDGAERRANVEELLVAASNAAIEERTVSDFLAETALATDVDRMSDSADRVVLMTAHNAKGLEFPVIVVVRLEEGLFPHANSLDQPERLEEERRLFYAALTRARDEVRLLAAAYRRRYDGFGGGGVSRFVAEIPEALMRVEEGTGATRRFAAAAAGRNRPWASRERTRPERHAGHDESGERVIQATAPLRTTAALSPRARQLGKTVAHERFGSGVILDVEDEGDDVKYTVRFGTRVKKVLGRFLTMEGDRA